MRRGLRHNPSIFSRTVFLRSSAWRSDAPLVVRLVAVFGFGWE